MNNRLINTKVAGGGCTDIVDNYDPFGGNGVALYQLNGDATDESGNYNGTASNVTYGTGVFGQAGVFANSSSSRIEANAAILPADVFSVSMWMKVTNLSNNKWILTQYTGGVTGRFVFNYNAEGGLQINVSSSNSGTSITKNPIVENVWQHIVLIKNGSSGFQIYVDNQSIGTWSNTSNIITNQNTVFGGNQNVTTQSIDGQLDQVRIFNTALTPLEVEALYTEELCICDGTVDTLDILGDGSCIATYQLDGNANDLSGNYSGTPTDVSYGVGEFDLAGVFNGSSSYIKADSSVTSSGAFSASFWFNMQSLSASYSPVILANTLSGQNGGFQVRINYVNGKIEFFPEGGGQGTLLSNVVPVLNSWYHIVGTFDGSTFKLYVNNSLQTNTLTGTLTSNPPNDLYIGTNPSILTRVFNGSIDQVRIFNKALSAGEVTTLYNETPCN